MKPWLYPGAKVVCIAPRFQPQGLRLRDWRRWHLLVFSRDPKFKEVCTVTDVWEQGGSLALQVAGYFPAYRPHSFRPLVDTSKTVEALRKLAREAKTSGGVTAVNTLADDRLDRKVPA